MLTTWAFRRATARSVVGWLVAVLLPLSLPEPPASALWWTAAGLPLLAPWLVLDRERQRRVEGPRAVSTRRGALLVLMELVPALLVLFLASLLAAGGRAEAGLSLFAWGALWLAIADALDRATASAGLAFTAITCASLAWFTAPCWLAAWFGVGGHWLASLSIALHPVGSALAGAELPTLQDAVFYRFTMSGVVEARALPWYLGASLFSLITVLTIGQAALMARSSRRSHR